MKIAVAGVGYVGLVTAVTLADIGHDVICPISARVTASVSHLRTM